MGNPPSVDDQISPAGPAVDAVALPVADVVAARQVAPAVVMPFAAERAHGDFDLYAGAFRSFCENDGGIAGNFSLVSSLSMGFRAFYR
jgi:hypothetical protein